MTGNRLVNFFILLSFLTACSANRKAKTEDPVSRVIREARTYSGTPYRLGGSNHKGIDCSGLTCQAFKSINMSLPRTADAQASLGKKVQKSELKPGDLVFFTEKKRSRAITHVGLVTTVKRGEVKFINATTRMGVIESGLSEEYWHDRYKLGKRVIRN